jgi:hypothetical protein
MFFLVLVLLFGSELTGKERELGETVQETVHWVFSDQ